MGAARRLQSLFPPGDVREVRSSRGTAREPPCGPSGRNHPQGRRSTVILSNLKRLVRDESGMEMVEWAIVGVVFAVAAAAFWGDLATNVDAALGEIETKVNP
jgi:Flp pilus assembly pilin Flp